MLKKLGTLTQANPALHKSVGQASSRATIFQHHKKYISQFLFAYDASSSQGGGADFLRAFSKKL